MLFMATFLIIWSFLSCFPTVLPDEREFQRAAKMNNLATMEELLKKNVDINAVDTVSIRCLTDACCEG